jgi:hypothetical protein
VHGSSRVERRSTPVEYSLYAAERLPKGGDADKAPSSVDRGRKEKNQMKHLFGFCVALALAAFAESAPAEFYDPEPLSPASASAPGVPPTTQPLPRRPRPDSLPFRRGAVGVTLTLASGFRDDNSYLILGTGLGYYILSGLELGLDGAIWLFDSPTIGMITPQAKYVLEFVPVIKPYIGTFYRQYVVGSGIDDFDSAGGRAGVYFVPGSSAYFGLGAVYEHLIECEDRILPCDAWYPEGTIAVSF